MILFSFLLLSLTGKKLVVDPKTETFTNSDDGNALLKRQYRKPWAVPDQV